MKKTLTYTSTIPIELMKLLNHYSKVMKIPKSKIIEKSVERYLHNLKRNEYAESFKRAKNDSDIKELTDMGFDDFTDIISK